MSGGPRKPAGASEQFGDHRMVALQDRLARLEKLVGQSPLLVGRFISVDFTGGTDRIVNHGLGVPAAFLVCRQNYLANNLLPVVIEAATQVGVDLNHQLKCVADVTCRLDLLFFPRASKVIDLTTGQSR